MSSDVVLVWVFASSIGRSGVSEQPGVCVCVCVWWRSRGTYEHVYRMTGRRSSSGRFPMISSSATGCSRQLLWDSRGMLWQECSRQPRCSSAIIVNLGASLLGANLSCIYSKPSLRKSIIGNKTRVFLSSWVHFHTLTQSSALSLVFPPNFSLLRFKLL